MSAHADELLAVAESLLAPRSGTEGASEGQVRRSISSSYYALFHFLAEEAGCHLLGAGEDRVRRRRLLARTFTHRGVKAALDKLRGPNVDRSVEEFFRSVATPSGTVPSMAFVRQAAEAFADSQAHRHDADYDLTKAMSATNARLLHRRVTDAIGAWRAARGPGADDFKQAVCVLMLLKGRLRED